MYIRNLRGCILALVRLCHFVKAIDSASRFKINENLGVRKTLLLEYKGDDGPTTVGTEATSLSPLWARAVRPLHVATNTDTGDGLRI